MTLLTDFVISGSPNMNHARILAAWSLAIIGADFSD
jgi:hypothetical protein